MNKSSCEKLRSLLSDGLFGSYSVPEVRFWEVASPVTLAIDSGWVTAYSEVMLFENHVFMGKKSCGFRVNRISDFRAKHPESYWASREASLRLWKCGIS